MKRILLISVIIPLFGCTQYKLQNLKKDYHQKIEVTIESARLHEESACTLGYRIKQLIDQYDNGINQIIQRQNF